MEKGNNVVASVLRFIGILGIIVGIVVGLYLGNETSWSFGFTWLASSFVSGVMFIGFAEIIDLLHKIYEKDNKNPHLNTSTNTNTSTSTNTNTSTRTNANTSTNTSNKIIEVNTTKSKDVKYIQEEWILSPLDETRIEHLFSKQGLKVSQLITTPYRDVVYVKLENNTVKIMEVGYNTPKEIPSDLFTDELNHWIKAQS